ncbi:bifunctional adenosylcobinamide kinase/adenosylcobinamide-phosphate guanylyltransferase [Anaerosporobacter sp.]
MKLIVGGTAQGKLEAAKKLVKSGYSEEQSAYSEDKFENVSTMKIIDEKYDSVEVLYSATIINHFHLIIKRLLQEKQEPEFVIEELIRKNSEVCIVSTEIGYGIVPMDSFEREYRERTGRICCKIAKRADEVYRILCGIATRIK